MESIYIKTLSYLMDLICINILKKLTNVLAHIIINDNQKKQQIYSAHTAFLHAIEWSVSRQPRTEKSTNKKSLCKLSNNTHFNFYLNFHVNSYFLNFSVENILSIS